LRLRRLLKRVDDVAEAFRHWSFHAANGNQLTQYPKGENYGFAYQ
jgi:hypothetical protein